MTDSYPVLFERALAQALETAGLGQYDLTEVYTAASATVANPAILMGPNLPTTLDNCIVITALEPIPDGRANILWRYQMLGRLKGTKAQIKNLAWNMRVALDHKQNIPSGFDVSWSWVFSELLFSPDSSGRQSFTQTVYFRGRRPL